MIAKQKVYCFYTFFRSSSKFVSIISDSLFYPMKLPIVVANNWIIRSWFSLCVEIFMTSREIFTSCDLAWLSLCLILSYNYLRTISYQYSIELDYLNMYIYNISILVFVCEFPPRLPPSVRIVYFVAPDFNLTSCQTHTFGLCAVFGFQTLQLFRTCIE